MAASSVAARYQSAGVWMRALSLPRVSSRCSQGLPALLACAFQLACGAEVREDPHRYAAPIVRGMAAGDMLSSLVALIREEHTPDYSSLAVACSGVLIASDVVLTAAHCLQDPGLEPPDPRAAGEAVWHVSFEPDLTQIGLQTFELPSDAVHVREAVLHPEFSYLEPAPIGLGPNHDLALLRLAEHVTSRVPATVLPATLRAALHAQREVVIGGYGLQNPDGETSEAPHDPPGLRAVGRSLILEVAEQELRVGAPDARMGAASFNEFADKCSGDSGGPSLIQLGNTEYVVGIA
ncbi:MAG TPA: trypsin-like serine protease, partial [Polyangiaceae bacterium]|nr:trypsin-like serine protease [Polyangiaceae bacterium]